jgi:hypothetical protein
MQRPKLTILLAAPVTGVTQVNLADTIDRAPLPGNVDYGANPAPTLI